MDATAPLESAVTPRGDLSTLGLYRVAIAALIAAVVTISLGGMTTSTGSGMAFYDWPLANGSLWPDNMTLAGYFEHLHRASATVVGLLAIAMVIMSRGCERWVRWCTIALLGVVVAQGLIGGLRVLKDDPYFTSVAHGVLAQFTLGFIVFLAFVFSRGWLDRVPAPSAHVATARKFVVVALVAMVFQLLMGAIARHTGSGTALWSHVGFALVVAAVGGLAVAYVGGRFKEVRGVARAARWVGWALLLQLVLGFAALAVRMDKHPENIQFLWRCSLRTSHVLVGALLISSTAYMAFRVFRTLVAQRASEGAAGS